MRSDDIKINPSLNIPALAESYAAHRFVQIEDFFAPETAVLIDRQLRGVLPWRFVYYDAAAGVVQLSQAEMQALGREGMQQRMETILRQAQRNIGYCYYTFSPGVEADHGDAEGGLLSGLAAFLNSPAFLEFGSRVIRETGLTKTDAQASLFRPGHFLTRHIDQGSQNERRAAYTLGFSRNWQTDWGGQLQFIDPHTTDVTGGWIPRWNTLNLFDGRQVHSVSPVSAFAGDGRYSVVGWLRND